MARSSDSRHAEAVFADDFALTARFHPDAEFTTISAKVSLLEVAARDGLCLLGAARRIVLPVWRNGS